MHLAVTLGAQGPAPSLSQHLGQGHLQENECNIHVLMAGGNVNNIFQTKVCQIKAPPDNLVNSKVLLCGSS